MICLLSLYLSLYTSRPIRLGTCDNLYIRTKHRTCLHLHICAPCDVEQAGIADMQVRGFMSGLIRFPSQGYGPRRSASSQSAKGGGSLEWRVESYKATHSPLTVLTNFRGSMARAPVTSSTAAPTPNKIAAPAGKSLFVSGAQRTDPETLLMQPTSGVLYTQNVENLVLLSLHLYSAI